MNSRHLLLTVLETGSPRPGFPDGQVLLRTFFGIAECQWLVIPACGGERVRDLEAPLRTALRSHTRGLHPHGPITTNASPPDPMTLGVRIGTYEFGGDRRNLLSTAGVVKEKVDMVEPCWVVTLDVKCGVNSTGI